MVTPANPLTLHSSWDLVATEYQAEVEPQFAYFAHQALELAAVKPGARVVDVACGPGTLAFIASRRQAQVCALDFSPAMIQCLKQRLEREGGQIEAVVGNGMALPWPDQSFDAGFSLFGLMFFPDRHRGLTELARVLKPGARAVVSSWVPMERVPIMADLYRTLAQRLPDLPLGGSEPPLSSIPQCESEVLAGGFREVSVRECRCEIEVDSLEVFWSSIQRSTPPVRLVADKVGPIHWPAISKKVLDTVTSVWGTGPQKVSMIAYLTVGAR